MPSLALYLCLCCQTDGEYKPIQKAAIGKYGSVLYHIPDSLNKKNKRIMIKKFSEKVADEATYTNKEVLTSEETARYMGISLSYLYKLTMRQQIPHYKPMGKMCYFNRVEVEEWLQRNRVATDVELNDRAKAYCMKGGAR